MTINDTAIPTMKVEALYTLADSRGLVGSAPLTLKIGIQPNQVAIQRDRPMVRPSRKSQAHRP